jgi:hypothetical protein
MRMRQQPGHRSRSSLHLAAMQRLPGGRCGKLLGSGGKRALAVGHDRLNIVAAALTHRRRKRAGTMQRIGGNDAAFQRQKVQRFIPATRHSFVAKGARTAYSFSRGREQSFGATFGLLIAMPKSVGRPDLRSVTLYSRAIARVRSRDASPPLG